jgi:hypothetical protein
MDPCLMSDSELSGLGGMLHHDLPRVLRTITAALQP